MVRVRDLITNLLASVVAGFAVWVAQRLLRYRRLARTQAFFGLDGGTRCLLTVARHASSPHELSVHRSDVAALVELATIARDCGSRADLVAADEMGEGIGRVTEFSVGGPTGNPRTATHLRALLPGIAVGTGEKLAITVDGTTYERVRDRAEYVLLARLWPPAGGRPVFVLSGQTARTNVAAARFLANRHPELRRRYGSTRPFCLVLRVVEPAAYGPDLVEIAADVTEVAAR